MNAGSDYVLGHADPEIQRLQFQARMIEGVTRRLIQECGIGRGMRVLDIGCGAGDVSMLLADAVGPSGAVVGIDREPRAVDTARARAFASGYRQIDFALAADDGFPDYPPFDAAIGRYVLIYQTDPATMVRRAAAAVKPGGIVAFHELALHVSGQSLPVIDLLTRVEENIRAAFRAAAPGYDVGGRLVPCFEDAGLAEPHVFWESLVGSSDSPLCQWIAMTYQAMLPVIQRLPVNADIGDVETLADRLSAAAASLRSQIVSPPQACAWAIRLEDTFSSRR